MRALLLGLLIGCRRDVAPATDAAPPAATAASVAPSASTMVDPTAHVVVLEEVAAVHGKNLPCAEVDAALAPLRTRMNALGNVADPRLGAAIEKDEALRARRKKALDAIMDGVMRCRRKSPT